ncbi:hypothetical protein CXB51_011664 [Gossypium anomalum]|uniref:Uncharacterized protein n=1 Tax=Gossypium anomalum TaxID=47600 RepID=A0A8J5Z4S5_9ROSI|nr:hypothetical protein CXB51_011664 [Gossypium anomalum]
MCLNSLIFVGNVNFLCCLCLLCLECLNGWDKIVYFDCFLNNFPFYSTCGNKISYIIFIGLQQGGRHDSVGSGECLKSKILLISLIYEPSNLADVRCTFLLHQLHCLVGSRRVTGDSLARMPLGLYRECTFGRPMPFAYLVTVFDVHLLVCTLTFYLFMKF